MRQNAAFCGNGLTIFFVLFHQIGEKYPNSVVEMHMNSTSMPQMKISESGISMSFEGLIDMYANLTDKPLAFLLTLDAVSREYF